LNYAIIDAIRYNLMNYAKDSIFITGAKEQADLQVKELTIYPNPFKNLITFSYVLNEPSQVCLKILNSYGDLIAEPVKAYQEQGEHKVRWNAEGLPAGVYFCQLKARNQLISNKIIKL
jgi:hypothetical protein